MAKDHLYEAARHRLARLAGDLAASLHVTPRIGITVNVEAEYRLALAEAASAIPAADFDDSYRRAYRDLQRRG